MYISPIFFGIPGQYRHEFGYMVNQHNGTVNSAIALGYPWMMDNGVFSNTFTENKWLYKMDYYQQYAEACLAVVVPDALEILPDKSVVGNWRATIERFHKYVPMVRERGYRTAFVSQDGVPIAAIPWQDLDMLFVGGSNQHKLVESFPIIEHAKQLGKHVHIGRVNSRKRIDLFWMADSWDGTTLAIEPSQKNIIKILLAARAAKQRREAQCMS